jgi:hypothetical protein
VHELILQVFYSIDGKSVAGSDVEGPGELRMMAVKLKVQVPSCCCTTDALVLPTCELSVARRRHDTDGHCLSDQTAEAASANIDEVLSSPPGRLQCMCGHTFAELGEAAMRRLQNHDREEVDASARSERVAEADEASTKARDIERNSYSRS